VAISVVGGIAAGAINGGNPSLVLTGMGVAQNDVVLVFGGIGGTAAGTQGATGNNSGAYQQLVSNDSGINQFYVGWQRMGATPDTTITCNGNGDSGDGAAYACIVLRGVTTDSPPTDATTTTATPTTTTNPDPPQIDWSTAGTAVIVGALSAVNDAAITIPTGYSTTNMASFTATANDGEDASVAIAYDLTPSDPENPGTFTGWASGLWQAATVAIKPAAGTFGDGDLSGGSIAGTATLVGASTAVAPLSATGTGTATLAGAATASSALAATGTGTGLFTGDSFADGALSATGTGTAAFAGVEVNTAGALAATGTGTASFAGDYDAFNCGLLLNDGSSYVLLNDGSAVLLNDDSCLVAPNPGSTEDADLSATGTGTAAFAGASTADSVLAATGTGTATFVGASSADSALAATGTGTALFTGASTADAPFSITGTGTASFNGESTADSVLSATGTATAAFVGDYDSLYNCGLVLNDGTSFVLLNDGGSVVLLNDASCALPPVVGSALSATGTGTATFVGASTADGALAATGTWTASFVGASTADASLSATGTATVSFVGASNADSILAATGTATVSWNYAEEGQAAASATGTATVAFVGAATVDAALLAQGGCFDEVFQNGVFQPGVFQQTPSINFVGDYTVATPETPPVAGGAGGAGGFPGAWKARKKRKKKDALDELDELLVAVSEQIAPWSAAKAYEADQALYRSVLERGKQLDMDDTLARIEAEIVNVKELLAEMDDEEALLLLM
jgi:fibronectin-binding autotransporter adhesin